jgi:uncharacterized protein (DUF486 family)
MLTKNPTKLNCKIGTQTSMAAFFTAMEIFMSLAHYKNYSQGSCTWLWHALISWLVENISHLEGCLPILHFLNH